MKIETPCHENFSKMPADQNGRYCGSCSQSVIDFTGMTGDEIKTFFASRSDQKVCGRFYNGQLENSSSFSKQLIRSRDNIISRIRFKPFRVAAIITFLALMLVSCRRKASPYMLGGLKHPRYPTEKAPDRIGADTLKR